MTRVNMVDTLTEDGFRGNYLIDGQLGELISVPWNAYKGKTPLLVIRPLPEVDEEGNELPMFERLDSGTLLPTYWMVRGRGWWKTAGITFFVQDALTEQGSSYRSDEEPAGLICRGVCDQVSSSQAPASWAKMQKEGLLPKSKYLPYIGLMQAIVYQNYDRYDEPHGLFEGDRIPVIAMTDTCSRKILAALAANPKPGAPATIASATTPEELMASLLYGNAVGLESPEAKFIAIARENANLDQILHGVQAGGQQRQTTAMQSFGGRRQADEGANKMQTESHDYRVLPEWNGANAMFDTQSAEFIRRQQIKPWRRLTLNHTRERQVELLQGVLPWDVMAYCWNDFPSWVPGPDTASYKKHHGSTSVAQGGHGVPQGTTAAAGQVSNQAGGQRGGSSFRTATPDSMLAGVPNTGLAAATAAVSNIPAPTNTDQLGTTGRVRRNPRA